MVSRGNRRHRASEWLRARLSRARLPGIARLRRLPFARGSLPGTLRAVSDVVSAIVAAQPLPMPAPQRPLLRRLAGLLPYAMWALALILFLSGVAWIGDNSDIQTVVVPVVAALLVLPLVVAVSRPLAAWALLLAVAAVAPLLIPPTEEAFPWPPLLVIASLPVLYAVALRHPPRTLLAVWAVTVGDAYLTLGLFRPDDGLGNATGVTLFITLLLVLGYYAGARWRLRRELAEGERRRQEEEARRVVLEERARIARELHDVVAHHMSLIAVQAETTPYRIPDLPEAGRATLAEIGVTARAALAEMRRLLGVLRNDTTVELAPQPRLDQLGQLVAGARRAGLAVATTVTGEPLPLPPGVELSAYRIVQEALSNAARHARGASVRVEIGHEPDRLRIRVTNDPPPVAGRGAPRRSQPGGRGQGLLGMRERAAMLGGQLSADATPDGGYRVEAVLPLPESWSSAGAGHATGDATPSPGPAGRAHPTGAPGDGEPA